MILSDTDESHLDRWLETRYFPSAEDKQLAKQQIVDFLYGVDQDDADYYLDWGWTKLLDHVQSISSCS